MFKVKKKVQKTIHYLMNGNRHREDGPAWIWEDGTKMWFKNGKRHREDGPAIEAPNGDKMWYLNGKRHRLEGPAVIWSSNNSHRIIKTEYWIEDKQYEYDEWIKVKVENV